MFSVYLDKESAGQTSITAKPTSHNIRTGPVGKNFQPVGKPPIDIARKALGDINQRLGSTADGEKHQMEMKKPAKAMLKFPQPASKPPKQKQKEAIKDEIKVQETVELNEKQLPPIESMPVWEDKEDDFDHIWPVNEQPATYIEAFREWRPLSMFQIQEDSDSDSEFCLSLVEPEDPVREYTFGNHLLDSPVKPEMLLSLDELGLSLPPPHELFPEPEGLADFML